MDNKSKQIYNYTVLLEKEADGGYHAFCPVLKGCHSQGDSLEEAIENITEAIELYLESLQADNQPIPRDNARRDPDSANEEDRSLSLEERIAFLKLPLTERRRVLESQAGEMQDHHQQDLQWRELMAGDIIDY